MPIPAPTSCLPFGAYVCGTLTKDATAIILFGVDTPKWMERLIIRGEYELWATEPVRAERSARGNAEPVPRMLWLVKCQLSPTLVRGRIVETALIMPDDDAILQALAHQLRVQTSTTTALTHPQMTAYDA